ncbi:serine hydrolase [Pseudomaricurvus alkylphenolicus]|uniref:serine hydrolase n=1 Tax=Pseudomaricurvus alkylphenolicus TaxID=1306991 RepID=UPI001424882B|nr:serine hydrolase [Pseudomaricurvus alkylphenolicus]NIB38424.1 serine hydrolase [Pseudomaricurvus alkylphenolicus]
MSSDSREPRRLTDRIKSLKRPKAKSTIAFTAMTLLVALVVATATTSSPQSSQAPLAASSDYSSMISELSQQVQGVVDTTGITGLSIALVDDQDVVWSQGFGFADKENGIKATAETVYGVASVSKLFTATAIMQLAEKGKIDIDQPLQTYIPEFSIKSRFADSGLITARNVMTHHSGLPSDLLNGGFANGDDKVALTESAFDGLLKEIDTAYVGNPANTTFSYSNLGFSLLGHAVKQASGKGFIDYMDQMLLQPLGMKSSSFSLTPEIERLRSKEYRNGEEVEPIWGRDLPAGALNTNVEDLSRFMMMVFSEGERSLKAETLMEMLTPQNSNVPLDLDIEWGLGWWLLPVGLEYAGRSAWHSGGEGMWNSMLYTLPDHKLGVVVLSNSAEAAGPGFQIAVEVLAQALAVKAGLEKPETKIPEVISLTSDQAVSYKGRYTTDAGPMDIRVDGDHLYVDLLGTSFKLIPHSDGRFSVEGLPWSEAHITIRTVDGRTAIKIMGGAVGGLVYGERIEPSPVSQVWMDRLGTYQISNGKPGFTEFFARAELKHEDGFLLLDFVCAIECERVVFPIGPTSDVDAIILGLGQRIAGETVSFVDVEGEEHLFFSGYLMKKL